MKKVVLLFTLLSIVFCMNGFAQTFSGFNTFNYSGVKGAFFNPANIADSRYRWDINLISLNLTITNDYASIKTSKIISGFKGNSNLDSFITRSGVSNANFMMNVDIFGPSFMAALNNKSSIAVTTRARLMANIDKIPNSLLDGLENNGKDVTYPSTFTSNKFDVLVHAWSEIGFTYARVITNNSSHFLKGGITLKYLGGAGSGYFVSNSMNGTLNQDVSGNTYLQNSTGQILFGSLGLTDNNFKLNFSGNGGIGSDIGFVYEFRPINNKEKDINRYKFKIDLALLDLGSISYHHSSDDATYSLNTANNNNPPGSDTLQLHRFSRLSNFSDLTTALKAAFPMIQKTDSSTGKYRMTLPTSLSFGVDYNLFSSFYLDLGGLLSLNEGGSKIEKTHIVNNFALTPRYERRGFGIAVPLSTNEISGFNAGISLRLGPLFFGSGNILSTLINGNTKQVDFHFGLHFGSLKKNKKPAIKKEVIKEDSIIPVPVKIVDTDGDGIPDSLDKCPTVPGFERYQGCPIPDTDSDGVNDEIDKCPTVPGFARYQGCPIPDTDSDGVNDEIDKCPTVPGFARYQGCPIPDTDSDGVNDEIDKCPTIPGFARYQGCPIPDTDSDGVNDEVDSCPRLAGPASNKGCPVINKDIIKKVNFAAKSLLFQTGKAVILKKSYPQLNIVAKILKSDTTLNLEIDGYTDNSGDSIKNLKLSTNRSNAAKAFLLKKGIAEERIWTQGFGPSKPISSNKTPSGRIKNRRVEFILKNYK